MNVRGWLVGCLTAALLAVSSLVGTPQASAATTVGAFTARAPVRILDTRIGIGAPAAAVAAGGTVRLYVGAYGAAALNVTVTQGTSSGFITVYPDGAALPNASNVNYGPGQTVANMAVVKVGRNGYVDFRNTSKGRVHLVADLAGTFSGDGVAAASKPGMFTGVTPFRVFDRRNGGTILSPEYDFGTPIQLAGVGGVPATGVSAVVVNLTVTMTESSGYLMAFPSGTPLPATSNLNYGPYQTVANLATVKLGSDGKMMVRNMSSGIAMIVVDVLGYYLAGTPTDPGAFVALDPVRMMDTRSGLGAKGPVAAGGEIGLSVTDQLNLPAGRASAVVQNLTVTEPRAAGFITAFPAGGAVPNASNVNYGPGQTIPNMAITALSPTGSLRYHNSSSGTVQLVADAAGYFLAQPTSGLCADPLTMTWNTPLDIESLDTVGFGLDGVTGPVMVDWGDPGAPTPAGGNLGGNLYTYAPTSGSAWFSYRYSSGNQYASGGVHTVKVCGSAKHFSAYNPGVTNPTTGAVTGTISPTTLTAVTSWGTLGLSSLSYGLAGARNLTTVPATLPVPVTDINHLFWKATAFNQPIGGWDTSRITDLSGVFSGASSFNQPLSSWNTAQATTMAEMFSGAASFNRPIGNWNTSSVLQFDSMFSGATAFNQPVGAWDLSHAWSTFGMFNSARSFNQPLQSWDVHSVAMMGPMFAGATSFNQPLGAWNTQSLSNAWAMFAGASSFDQPLGSWNVQHLDTATGMFSTCSLSTANYDNLLKGWAAQTVHKGVDFTGGTCTYSSAAASARSVLTGTYQWKITDGGPV